MKRKINRCRMKEKRVAILSGSACCRTEWNGLMEDNLLTDTTQNDRAKEIIRVCFKMGAGKEVKTTIIYISYATVRQDLY